MRPAAPAVLRVALGPSRRLAVSLAAVHLLAVGGVAASQLPGAVCATLLVALVANLGFALRCHAWRSCGRSCVGFDLSETLDVEVTDRSGRHLAGSVLGSSFAAPWLVVIHFKVKGSHLPRAIVVPPDATDVETHRRLRVWLRWRRADTAQDA